jgi:hypothetical protein
VRVGVNVEDAAKKSYVYLSSPPSVDSLEMFLTQECAREREPFFFHESHDRSADEIEHLFVGLVELA